VTNLRKALFCVQIFVFSSCHSFHRVRLGHLTPEIVMSQSKFLRKSDQLIKMRLHFLCVRHQNDRICEFWIRFSNQNHSLRILPGYYDRPRWYHRARRVLVLSSSSDCEWNSILFGKAKQGRKRLFDEIKSGHFRGSIGVISCWSENCNWTVLWIFHFLRVKLNPVSSEQRRLIGSAQNRENLPKLHSKSHRRPLFQFKVW
jgi:hypothetical protein